MKIKMLEERVIPGVGVFPAKSVIECSDDLGTQLCQAGQAVAVMVETSQAQKVYEVTETDVLPMMDQ